MGKRVTGIEESLASLVGATWSTQLVQLADGKNAPDFQIKSALEEIGNHVRSNEKATQKLLSQQQAILERSQSHFERIASKLDQIDGTATPFADTPLNRWSFLEYRRERDRLQERVEKAFKRRKPAAKSKVRVYADELLLGGELIEKGGIRKGAETAWREWTADPGASLALMIPSALTYTVAATQYIPCVIAILHYLEQRHVKQQLRSLGEQAAYLLDVREGEAEAAIRAHWHFARELLLVGNRALARMGLREVCRTVAALRHAHIRESVSLYERGAQPANGNTFSPVEMNRCLRTIDRLIDAVLLEFFIRIALGESDIFSKQQIADELREVNECLKRCKDIKTARARSAGNRQKMRKILLPLRTTPMRLRAYRTLLELIARSGGSAARLTAPKNSSP